MTQIYHSHEERMEARKASCRKAHWKFRNQRCHYTLWKNARDRAKIKEVPFSLAREDIVIPDKCPILDIPLSHGFENGRESSPSVDRIDLTKGYTPDNIQVISYKANRAKNNLTLKEVVALGKWAENVLNSNGEPLGG